MYETKQKMLKIMFWFRKKTLKNNICSNMKAYRPKVLGLNQICCPLRNYQGHIYFNQQL